MLTLNSVGGQETKLKKIPENMLDQLSQYYNSKQLDLYAKRHFYSYWNLYAKIHPEVFAWVFFCLAHRNQQIFSAILDFIIWFCTSLSRETWSFELISQSVLFYAQQQKRVFKPSFWNPAFQNSGSNPTWFWKPEKNPFQTRERPFLVYFKRATIKHKIYK